MSKMLNLKLKNWRQNGPHAQGAFLEVDAHDIPEDASFLEMLDVVNERLIADDVEPVTFGHDCREGICGTCGVMINGQAHGPEKATATCQLHMRKFNDGDEIVIEPWQATSFPILKDLMVDRRAFDRIVEAGGYISLRPALRRTPTRSRSRRSRRHLHGCRRLHRLWCLCRCVSELSGAVVHLGQASSPQRVAPGQ